MFGGAFAVAIVGRLGIGQALLHQKACAPGDNVQAPTTVVDLWPKR